MLLATKILALLLIASAALAVGSGQASQVSESDYKQEIEKWRGERVKELTGENGWLTLVGLFWLKEGKNRLGSAPSNEIVFPAGKAPRFAGTILLDKGKLSLQAARGARITHQDKPVTAITLQSDADGEPTLLNLGPLSFLVIKRGERFGLRVRDKTNPARFNFTGLDYYPLDLRWRLEARFEPYDPPRAIPIMNVLGMVEDQPSPGAVVFEVGGKSYRLDAIAERGSKELFIILADQTTGRETYGAGRYLYAAPPGADQKTVLDFNKAYNPPCAFTKYATCPLPPRQNRLALRIEAGEKKPAHLLH